MEQRNPPTKLRPILALSAMPGRVPMGRGATVGATSLGALPG